METPVGSWAFRVSGNTKPHRGLVFFYPKNGIPTGVSGIQSVWKCKTPPGSGVFLFKNEIPTGVSGIQGVWKCKTPPGSSIFIVNYSTSWILADNFSLDLFVFPKSLG